MWANLPECYSPFTELVALLVKPGEPDCAVWTAGWCVSDLQSLGYTSPVKARAGVCMPSAAAGSANNSGIITCLPKIPFHLRRILSHHAARGPLLPRLAGWLTRFPGKWVGPSNSPENRFRSRWFTLFSEYVGPS